MSRSKIVILLGFGSILLLVTLLISVGVTNLNKSKSRLDQIVNSNNLKLQLVHQMRSSARERTISLQNMMIIENAIDLDELKSRMALYGGKFVSAREELLGLDLNQKEISLLEQQAMFSRKVGPLQNKIADQIEFGETKNAQHLLIEQAMPLQDKVFDKLSELQDIQRNATIFAIQENSDNYKQIVAIMWIVSSVVIIISLSIVFFIFKLISNSEKQQENYRQDIERQAFYDHLTGLPNRRLLHDRMQHAIENTSRSEVLLAVLFIDCDRFKPINDTLGHVVGDALLVSIANRIKNNLRTCDTVCRVSGDEFAIVLENIEHMSAIDRISQNILDAIAEPHRIEGHKVFTTVSIGITVFPLDDKNVNGLLTSADIAMYYAKQKGGNQYEFFNSDMNSRSKHRLVLEQDLHEALHNNELKIYYQPQNAIDSSRQIIGMEALLRWQHPKRGLVQPNDFISIAEDTGLIVSIGEWVLMSACQQVRQWQDQGYTDMVISINLSPRQFTHNNLVAAVQAALDSSGINPAQLDLEITESTAMHAIDKTIDILFKLKDLGVHISIDDFGTGYSSLSYLQQMPIDNLKIDRAFIRNLHHSTKDKAFVQAIVSMAHTLGMKTIAEGVELEEQFSFLEKIDCEIAQGYLFSKPVPPEQFEQLLKIEKTAIVSI